MNIPDRGDAAASSLGSRNRPSRIASLLPLAVLFVLLAVEFSVFDQIGARQHTKVYPRWNDQIQYLTEAYLAHEHAKEHGLLSAIRLTLTNPSAQGTVHDLYAVLTFAIAGPSRSAALAINMLALIAWQVALFFTIRRLSASAWMGLLAALLPLALVGPWRAAPGSAFDFRIDHLLMCTLGVTTCVALLTDGFRSRRWSLAFGLAVGVTLLTRFLSGTYFALIFVGALVWILFGPDRGRRSANLLVAGAAAFLLTSPVFWLNRDWIWNYYWIGHYVGPESAIRNQNFGLGQSVDFIARFLQGEHLGSFFIVVAVVASVVVLRLRQSPSPAARGSLEFIGALFLLAPALILTLHAQKSSVVLGALVPGLIALLVGIWIRWLGRGTEARVFPLIVVALTFLCTIHFVRAQSAPVFDPASEAQLRHVTRFGEVLASRAAAAGIASPRIAVDHVTDAFDGQVLRVTAYERIESWISFQMTLPTGIAEPTEAEVMERLQASDFVFVTIDSPGVNFPYDRKLAEMNPRIQAWCREHLVEAERFTLHGRTIALYQLPTIPLTDPRPQD